MKAFETAGTINESGQLILDQALGVIKPQRVRVIVLMTDDEDFDPEETPTEVVIQGIQQGLSEALAGQTIPLSKLNTKAMQYSGKWRITEMELWSSDYLDMEVEAYIEISPDGSGEFQFGLVCGHIRGKMSKDGEEFRFRWDGSDECDEASGSGWLKLKDENSLDGFIEFHEGDESELVAERISN